MIWQEITNYRKTQMFLLICHMCLCMIVLPPIIQEAADPETSSEKITTRLY